MHAAVRSPLGKTWSRDDDRAREDERERKPRGWTGYRERIIKTNGIIVKINLLKNFIKCGEENEIELKRVRERERKDGIWEYFKLETRFTSADDKSLCQHRRILWPLCPGGILLQSSPTSTSFRPRRCTSSHPPSTSLSSPSLKLPPSTIFTQL